MTQKQTGGRSPNGAERFNDWYMGQVRGVLLDWRARHPLMRACPPVPADLHTHTEPAKTDHARQLRQEREWLQSLMD